MKFITVLDLYILFVIALIKAVNWFSSPKLKEFVIKSVAYSAYLFSKNKRRLTEENLLQAFDGQLSEDQKRKIVEGTFYELWQDTFSLLPSDAERDALKEIKLQGVGHLQRAMKDEKGVILWESNSFCRRNLAKQILHENRFSIHQVHGEHHFRSFLNDGNSSTWVRHHIINTFFEKCGRHFATVIMVEQRFSTLRRITFVLVSSLLPLLLFYRTAKRVFKNRIYLKQFVLSSPLVFLGQMAWSWGEFLGYLSRSKE